jgi:hypothetical protein
MYLVVEEKVFGPENNLGGKKFLALKIWRKSFWP